MEFIYKRDLSGTYLLVEEGRFEESVTALKMLEKNHPKAFLDLTVKKMNGHVCLWYEVTSMQPLVQVFERKLMGGTDIHMLIDGIADVMADTRRYLLSPGGVRYEPEAVFVDGGRVRFMYVPEAAADCRAGLKELSEFILKRLDHKNRDAVYTGYAFYEQAQEGRFDPSVLPGQEPGRAAGIAADRMPQVDVPGGQAGPRPCMTSMYPGSRGSRPDLPGTQTSVPGVRPGLRNAQPGSWSARPGSRPDIPGTQTGMSGARPGIQTDTWSSLEEQPDMPGGWDLPGPPDTEQDGLPAEPGKDTPGRNGKKRWGRAGRKRVREGKAREGRFRERKTGEEKPREVKEQSGKTAGPLWVYVLGAASASLLFGGIIWFGKLDLTQVGGLFFGFVAVIWLGFSIVTRHRNKDRNIWAGLLDEKDEDEEAFMEALMHDVYDRPVSESKAEETPSREEAQEGFGQTRALGPIRQGAVLRLISQDVRRCRDLEVEAGKVLVGKSRDQVDICIPLDVISRVHACIEQDEDGCFITDRNSTNGTYLNGTLLTPQERVPLHEGDTVSFATVEFKTAFRSGPA